MLAGGQLVVEGAGRVLDGADQQVVEQVPVGERRLVQRLPAAPAADQVDEPVDPPEALDQRRAPAARRLLVEQVDGAPVPALAGMPRSAAIDSSTSGLRSVPATVAPASASRAATSGPSPPPTPAMAITRPSSCSRSRLPSSPCRPRLPSCVAVAEQSRSGRRASRPRRPARTTPRSVEQDHPAPRTEHEPGSSAQRRPSSTPASGKISSVRQLSGLIRSPDVASGRLQGRDRLRQRPARQPAAGDAIKTCANSGQLTSGIPSPRAACARPS